MCIHETTMSMLCFVEVFQQIMTRIVAWRKCLETIIKILINTLYFKSK